MRSPFQWMADKIEKANLKWIYKALGFVQDEILVPAFKIVGKIVVASIEDKIISESGRDIPGSEKFKNVFNHARSLANPRTIANDTLNTVIQISVSKLKKERKI